MKTKDPALRGQLTTPTGSPHLTTVYRLLPTSCVTEELHRTLTTKHRYDIFQGQECRGSPKKSMNVHLSKSPGQEAWSFDRGSENKWTVTEEENKENLMLSSELKDDCFCMRRHSMTLSSPEHCHGNVRRSSWQ